MNEELTVFRGSPSQVLNLPTFAVCALAVIGVAGASAWWGRWWGLALLAVPMAVSFWQWLRLRCRVYELTSQRLRTSTGVLTRRTDELELYRVNDITFVEPFLLRMFGLGNIMLTTNDVSSPTIVLPAIRGARKLREDLRQNVEACRARKGVRVTEME